jgi:hypothetical protein
MSKAIKKTRKQWACEICAIHKQTVKQTIAGIFKLGRMLIAAKKKLEYGQFLAMIESDLPFGARSAQMLMAVAADRRLTDANQVRLLPDAWRTLYELTKLPDEAFEQAVASGAITPRTTRADVGAMRPHYNPIPLTSSRDIAPERPPPLALVSSAGPTRTALVLDLEQATRPAVMLHQIERQVGELEREVGDDVVNVAFRMCAQSVAERLLAIGARARTH